MTIAAEIIEALRQSEVTHQAIVAEVERARAENDALKQRIGKLEAEIAELESKAANIVDPSIVQPLLTELGRIVAEGYTVISATRAPEARRLDTERPSSPSVPTTSTRSSARGWS